ncbi:MAG: FAD-binding oxidoreductase [Thermoprotei archaeon]
MTLWNIQRLKKNENIKKAIIELENILGTDRVFTDVNILKTKALDFTPLFLARTLRNMEIPLPDVIVKPKNADEVSKIVKIANLFNVPIIPLGGGSGVVGGIIATRGGILIDLEDLKTIEVDEENMIVHVSAGVKGIELEKELNKKGYTTGHYPQSIYDSTIGGWIATKAIGQYSTKYGGIEDIVVSLEVVLPTGEIITTKPVPRTSTGPDLKHIFIGSEGTLGIITSATLKIRPMPQSRTLLSYTFDDFNRGLNAVKTIMIKNLNPDVVRLYDEDDSALWFTGKVDKPLLIMVLEDEQTILSTQRQIINDIVTKHGGSWSGEELPSIWLKERFEAREKAEQYMKMGLLIDTIEVSGLWNKLPELHTKIKTSLKSIQEKNTTVLHASAHADHFYTNGGCLYFTIGGISENDPTYFYEKIWETSMKICLSLDCSISNHHGIGLIRVPWIKQELGPAYNILKQIKNMLDPKNIMNPDKLLQ